MPEKKILTDSGTDITEVYTAEKSNQHFHDLLSQGIMDLTVVFDWPTQKGYDSDHELAEGKVGRTGVAIDSIEDMQTLFQGIRLEDVTISLNIHATGYILLAFYTALAKQQGADLKKIRGTFQNELLSEYATGGAYIYPPRHSQRIITDIFEWCGKELPKWELLTLSGAPIREAGHTAVQETGAGEKIIAGVKADDYGFKADDSIRQIQTEKINLLKRRRDPARCDSILQDLNDKAASSDENIMPVVLEAVENRCTLGEIADTLREVFGEYR